MLCQEPNHGRQHDKVRGLSPDQEQGQTPAERHLWSEGSSVACLQHRCGALDKAHSLVGGTYQGHAQEAFPASLLSWHSEVMGSGYTEAGLLHQQLGVHQVHIHMIRSVFEEADNDCGTQAVPISSNGTFE